MTPLAKADRSINGLLQKAAERGGDRIWLRQEGTDLSFAEAARHVDARVKGLRTDGIGPGTRVVVALPNGATGILTLLSVMASEAICLAVDPKTTNLSAFAKAVRADHVLTDASEHTTRLSRGASDDIGHSTPRPDDPALTVFSSGSTGAPKGIMLSHQSLVLAAEATALNLELGPQDVVATSNPFFHVNAIVYAMCASLAATASLTVYSNFSASRMTERIVRDKVSILVLAAAAVPMWWDHFKMSTPIDAPLRRVLTGGAPAEVCTGLHEKTGAYIHTGYALSECPLGLLAPPPSTGPPRPSPAIGQLPHHPGITCEAGIFHDDGTPQPDGQEGEIWLRNPCAMIGYLDDEALTRTVLTDGWVRTGDLGFREADGTYVFVSRIKDMLRVRGEMFAPADIENALRLHPGVADAAAMRFGAGQGVGEDRIAAFVEVRPGIMPSTAELDCWCATHLPKHKRPEKLMIVGAFPRTGLGKVRKAELAARIFETREDTT